MPALLNWFLRLLPTNPICMRLVQGGSKRMRHLYIRAGYLGVLMIVLLFSLFSQSAISFSQLASKGAEAFELISYLQVGLICLLTPVFMAGAIAQEANPKTWDILLTTPMNNLQIVLGNMFGRLFFILALLLSTLPLFVTIQYFGGVPGEAIFLSYAIAACSAILVGAIAVTLCVTRTAGRRAVFIFYITVVMYLFVTYAIDYAMRQPVTTGGSAMLTTLFTPLNPFLAMEVLLRSNTYSPHDYTGQSVFWIERIWFANPTAAFCWLTVLISFTLIVFSTLRLRVIGGRVGSIPWYRKLFGLGARNANERPPRKVSNNPVAWRESVARGSTLAAMLARWGFAALGLVIAIVLLALFHTGLISAAQLRLALVTTVGAEIVIIALTALNMSATAVSREREDGSLDILLTTPIQPGPYLSGKLRGLIQFLLPMLCVPVGTLLLAGAYVLSGGLGVAGGVAVTDMVGGATQITLPVVLPEGAIALPLTLIPFTAFCVMVGLQWSIKSRGTIGSVIAAGGVVVVVAGILSLCGLFAGNSMDTFGGVVNAVNPVNLLLTVVMPASLIPDGLDQPGDAISSRAGLVIGAAIAGVVYSAIVYGMHTNMKRTFHMTVRKLAGQK